MRRRMLGLGAAWMLGLATVCLGGVGITPKISTLGFGGDITIGLIPELNVRAGYNAFSYSDEFEIDDATVDGKLDWATIPILLDWHPARTGFRISAGVVKNDNEIRLTSGPQAAFELDDIDFTIQRADGRIVFDDWVPYVGIGYGNAAGEGRFHFACDFGVMFQGKPKASASALAGIPAAQSYLDAALQREVDELQDDLDGFTIYPVISVGVSISL